MPDPTVLAQWMQVFFYLLGGVACIVGLAAGIRALRRQPPPTELKQPIEVRAQVRYATENDLDETERRMRGETDKLHGRISSMRDELSQQMRSLDSTVDSKLEALHKRVDAVPAATIALLKETKELHRP